MSLPRQRFQTRVFSHVSSRLAGGPLGNLRASCLVNLRAERVDCEPRADVSKAILNATASSTGGRFCGRLLRRRRLARSIAPAVFAARAPPALAGTFADLPRHFIFE